MRLKTKPKLEPPEGPFEGCVIRLDSFDPETDQFSGLVRRAPEGSPIETGARCDVPGDLARAHSSAKQTP